MACFGLVDVSGLTTWHQDQESGQIPVPEASKNSTFEVPDTLRRAYLRAVWDVQMRIPSGMT